MRHSLAPALATLCLGAGLGLAAQQMAALETKWLVYLIAGAIFLFSLIAIRNHERFLWLIFILGFQVHVSFRIFHGHADSVGIVFPLIFILSILLAGWYWLSGNFHRLPHFRFGGPLILPIIMLAIAAIASLVFTSEKFVGLTATVKYIQFYMLYLLALNFVTSTHQVNYIIKLLFIVLITQSIIYFIQVYFGASFSLVGEVTEQRDIVRPGGTVGSNSAIYAGFIMLILLIAVAHIASHEIPIKTRMYLLIPALLGSISLILTIRRSAYVGAFLGTIWIIVLGYKKRMVKPWILGTTTILTILTLLSLPVLVSIVESARTDNKLSSAIDERVGLMQMAVNVIANNPITGVGPGAYRFEFKNYLTADLTDQWLFTVHNAYLLITAEIGLVGGFAFILFLLTGIRLCLRVSNDTTSTLRATGLGLSGGIIAVSFEMFWEPFTHFYTPNALLWFLLGLMGAAEALSRSAEIPDNHI